MQRRGFLLYTLTVLGLPGVVRADRAARGKSRIERLPLGDCRLVGSFNFHGDQVLDFVMRGELMHLQRETDAPHDPYAVEAFWGGWKLGYLPRPQNVAAATLIDAGHALHAEVIAVDEVWRGQDPITLRVWVER